MGASAEEWEDFRYKKLLHVLPGDPGYVAWTHGKLAFFANIKAAIQECFITQGPEVPGLMVEDMETSFPLLLETL